METIAVFKKKEQAFQLSKKINSKGLSSFVSTRLGYENGLKYKLLVPKEIKNEVKALLLK